MRHANRRLRLEIKRKTYHVILALYPLLFIYFATPKGIAIAASLIYIAGWFISEFLRTRYNINTPTAMLLNRISRRRLSGEFDKHWKRVRIPYWLFGLTLVLIFFNYEALFIATVILAFGDSASAIVRVWLNNYSKWLGFASGVAVGSLILFMVTMNPVISLIPAMCGMFAEFLSSKLNDNLLIPVLAGASAFLL
ncbi:MAG: hypothetical protein M1504_00350 [Candidatus Marsarchaeota archaeon]|nr:hypothetical protein [Candidatus Marsarchaeota archaeon]